MNGFLRQSTASQVRTIGPFVDDTDFKTLKNALTIAVSDVKIKKAGGASGSKNGASGATADGTNGLYHLTWDATDTATVGELSVAIKVAGALVYFCTYVVIEEAVYDALYAASAPGYVVDQPVNVTKWAGSTSATGNIALKNTLVHGTDITGTPADSSASTAVKVVTDKMATMLETDAANWRYTKASLANTPLGASINGNVLLWEVWRWTTGASPTATGQVTVNNADWNIATSVKLNYLDLAGTNLGTYISNIRVNDVIRIQRESDNTIWNDYTVAATGTDNTTWRDIPVVRKTGSGVATPINGQNVLVAFFRQPDVDWTDTEKQQIRHRLGIDGTASAPATGNPSLPDAADITQLNTKLDTNATYVDTEVAAIKAKTDQLVFTAGKVDANAAVALTAGDLNSIADALLKRDWTALSGEAAYSALNAFRMLRNVWNTTGGTLSVKKEDGTTDAWTRTLTVDPTAQPIVGAS